MYPGRLPEEEKEDVLVKRSIGIRRALIPCAGGVIHDVHRSPFLALRAPSRYGPRGHRRLPRLRPLLPLSQQKLSPVFVQISRNMRSFPEPSAGGTVDSLMALLFSSLLV